MRHVGMVLLALLMFAPPLWAEVGDLVPVEYKGNDAVLPRPLFTSGPQPTTRPAGVSGLVHPKATVIALASGEGKVMLALDAAKADSAEMDVVRFDFSGKGQFSAEQSLPLKKLNTEGVKDALYWEFGPAVLKVAKGDVTLPVTVSGGYQSRGGQMFANVSAMSALEGKCQFGQKNYAVRIIDGGSNLCFSDALPVRLKEGKVSDVRSLATSMGDTVLLDLGGSGFAKGVKKTLFGAPVLVDGKWYELAVSADLKKVAAKPVEVQASQLLIPHEEWWAMLVGEQGVFYAAGGKEAVDIPAGNYALMYYDQKLGDGKPGGQLLIVDRDMVDEKQSVQVIAIAPGKKQELAIGTPLTASVEGKVTESQGTRIVNGLLQAVGTKGAAKQVELSMVLTDAGGRTVASFSLAGPTRQPTVNVLDAQGKQIASGKMEFG